MYEPKPNVFERKTTYLRLKKAGNELFYTYNSVAYLENEEPMLEADVSGWGGGGPHTVLQVNCGEAEPTQSCSTVLQGWGG